MLWPCCESLRLPRHSQEPSGPPLVLTGAAGPQGIRHLQQIATGVVPKPMEPSRNPNFLLLDAFGPLGASFLPLAGLLELQTGNVTKDTLLSSLLLVFLGLL